MGPKSPAGRNNYHEVSQFLVPLAHTIARIASLLATTVHVAPRGLSSGEVIKGWIKGEVLEACIGTRSS